MSLRNSRPGWIAFAVLAMAFGGVLVARLTRQDEGVDRAERGKQAVPVDVAPVQRGTFCQRRTFSGTIEPRARFTVAPKVSGLIQRLNVDVSDTVARGQVVAQLEDAEFRQAVAEAEARMAVAEANRVEATSRLTIAQRALDRAKALHERGIASDSALDSAQAEFLASQATVKVADATLQKENASSAAAEIRLGYTRIKADWEQGDDERTVAERYVDEGNTVAANTPLLSVVALDPVVAVIHVTEKDYPRIAVGQGVELRSDAFPGQTFTGQVSRIAPVFREASRQARVEMDVPNPGHLLKPGMFARCSLELDRAEDAVSVPELAVTRRNEQTGVFLVNETGTSVKWIEVRLGLRDGSRVQVLSPDLRGRVVTLGQQLIEDGSTVCIPDGVPVRSENAVTP